MLYQTKDTGIHIHRLINILLWLAISALGLACVYSPFKSWDPTRRAVWGLCLMWVTFACCRGYGGIVNQFLSWNFWLPISKISFMTYLFHMAFNFYFFLLQPYPVNYTMWLVTEWFLAQLCVCLLIGLLGCLTLELPFSKLQKMLIQRLTRPSGPK